MVLDTSKVRPSKKFAEVCHNHGELCKYQHIHQATGISLPRTLETNKQTLLKPTLDSGINIALGINVAPGTFGKNIKHSP